MSDLDDALDELSALYDVDVIVARDVLGIVRGIPELLHSLEQAAHPGTSVGVRVILLEQAGETIDVLGQLLSNALAILNGDAEVRG